MRLSSNLCLMETVFCRYTAPLNLSKTWPLEFIVEALEICKLWTVSINNATIWFGRWADILWKLNRVQSHSCPSPCLLDNPFSSNSWEKKNQVNEMQHFNFKTWPKDSQMSKFYCNILDDFSIVRICYFSLIWQPCWPLSISFRLEGFSKSWDWGRVTRWLWEKLKLKDPKFWGANFGNSIPLGKKLKFFKNERR